MALPNKLKSLIDKYCMGVAPSDEQMDEIFNMAGLLNADSAEVSDYIQEMISGPTKEEREAEEKRKREAEAARKAEMEAQKKAGADEDVRKSRLKKLNVRKSGGSNGWSLYLLLLCGVLLYLY